MAFIPKCILHTYRLVHVRLSTGTENHDQASASKKQENN